MNPELTGIPFAEAHSVYVKQAGQITGGALRLWLKHHDIPRQASNGRRALYDRAAFMRLLLEKHPKSPEQMAQLLQVALQNGKKAEPVCTPPRPMPDANLAKVNLMSWTVAAQMKWARDLANCPAHLADDRRRLAALFSNFIRCGVAPCVAGLLYDGKDAEDKVHQLADTLKRYANGQGEAPESPSWLTKAQEKITLIAATIGMELPSPDGNIVPLIQPAPQPSAVPAVAAPVCATQAVA